MQVSLAGPEVADGVLVILEDIWVEGKGKQGLFIWAPYCSR